MKLLKNILLLICIGMASLLNAHDYDKVKLKEQSVPISSVKNISGFFGYRMRLNREIYMKNFPINKYVDFITERQHTQWDWTKAEQHGKWVESACLSAIQSGDTTLFNKMSVTLTQIIDSQEDNGYVGSTARNYRTPQRPVRGMDAYELYFVLHAFITVYEQTGDEKALEAAEKLAGYYLAHFGPERHEFWPSKLRAPENKQKIVSGHSDFAGHSAHYSWEGTLLCDPVARLYEVTGKKKYLKWSQWVVNNIDKWSGWDAFSRLDSVAEKKLGVDDLQPYVHSHTFQMNFMGFLRLYRITGDKSLLRKVVGAWDDIRKRQMYITGGVSVGEHYEQGYIKPLSGNVVETCATMSWMQLTQMLLELTGEVKYADAMEQLMLNHVFAAQDCETGVCRYHTAPNGYKPNEYFHGPDCCTASGHRIISLLPTFFYAQNRKDFYINQYLPADYQGKDIAFRISGDYPIKEKITLTIISEKTVDKSLNLRIPDWCKAPAVQVNGKQINNIQPGSYLKLTRKWTKDDCVELYFPMEEQWIEREHHSKYIRIREPHSGKMYREEPAEQIPYAFLRGPLVYCIDMVWNKTVCNDDVNMEKDIRIDIKSKPVVTDNPYPDIQIAGPVFQTKANYMGRNIDILLTPFANIGQWYRPYEQKPNKYTKAFAYSIWLYPMKNNK